VRNDKEQEEVTMDKIKPRNIAAYALAIRGGRGAGNHNNRTYDVAKGYVRKGKYPAKEE